jgi:hypothetical protein
LITNGDSTSVVFTLLDGNCERTKTNAYHTHQKEILKEEDEEIDRSLDRSTQQHRLETLDRLTFVVFCISIDINWRLLLSQDASQSDRRAKTWVDGLAKCGA